MRRLGMLGIALVWPMLAHARGPILLSQGNVLQYQEAANAVKRRVPDVVEVEAADATAADQLKDASLIIAVGQKALKVAKQSGGSAAIVFCMVLGVARGELNEHVTGVPLESDPA